MDKLTIINKALLKCGLPLAAAVKDCDWNASLIYDSCARELLRGFSWGFAQNFVSIAQAGVPAHGFDHAYQLPADCLRVVDVHCVFDLRSPKARYVIQGKRLLTNVAPCYLRYISSSYGCESWPDDFCDALASRIAMEIAPLSGQNMSMTSQLAQLAQLALANAQATDARENAERVPLDHNILMSRATGNDRRGK